MNFPGSGGEVQSALGKQIDYWERELQYALLGDGPAATLIVRECAPAMLLAIRALRAEVASHNGGQRSG